VGGSIKGRAGAKHRTKEAQRMFRITEKSFGAWGTSTRARDGAFDDGSSLFCRNSSRSNVRSSSKLHIRAIRVQSEARMAYRLPTAAPTKDSALSWPSWSVVEGTYMTRSAHMRSLWMIAIVIATRNKTPLRRGQV
jgi:hypothetical protein